MPTQGQGQLLIAAAPGTPQQDWSSGYVVWTMVDIPISMYCSGREPKELQAVLGKGCRYRL